ncbi:MAG TPA: DUF3108 domain-containing protein [Dokdonella sp.]|uniref:DUF3108 domain-containing protein n=1 Tax=Dokdonella sp. TaxID=2291710 RepID=UPI002D7F8AC7|nr:DUF3108 domain-containing protein [Dokdonella sp.]HET9033339.1 DUF3108 domain-containing protein [Dokdonella sp.]
MNRIAILLICALAPVGHAFAESPIAPFKADYATFRNGKEMARTTIQLSRNADATWTMTTTTEGTSGLARMAGLDVTEESVLRWVDGRPETLRYDFRQEVAFKNKHRHGEFDQAAGEVHMVDGKSDARYALVPYTVDRHALTLALAADLSRHATSFDYKVAARDKIENVRYTRCADSRLSVPAGEFDTRCLERVRNKRTATSWFAESKGWIPVQIEQVESKGDTVTLRLVKLEPVSGER